MGISEFASLQPFSIKMIKITDIVKEILFSSEIALGSLSNGYLNLSAYAASIQKEVERRTFKQVRVGTIVVALSRIAKTLDVKPDLVPNFKINTIAVKTGLVEFTFEKTKSNRDKLQRIYENDDFLSADFFAVTYGVGELNIIVPEGLRREVAKVYGREKPRFYQENLSSLTVRFDDWCIQVPNVTFALVRPLALKRLNIVEIVSTFTELTFILNEDDIQEALSTLSPLMRSSIS